MATYYDGLNDFHNLNEQNPLQSSAQLVYLHLLQLNNRSGNTGTVQISDKELEYRTSLNKNTITNAKRILKNRGLIDFQVDKINPRAGTTYELKFFTLEQSLGQTSRNSPRFDSTKEKELKKKESIDSAGANFEELDELTEYWERTLRGGRLTVEHLSELSIYLERNGLEWVKRRMKRASDANNNPRGLQPNFLFAVLKNDRRQEKAKDSPTEQLRRAEEMVKQWS